MPLAQPTPCFLQVPPAHGPPAIPIEAGNGQFTAGTTANVAEGAVARVCLTGPELVPT